MIGRVLGASVAALCLLLPASPSLAHKPTCTFTQEALGATTNCIGEHTHGDPPPKGQPNTPVDPNAPVYEYRYIPTCGANTISNEADVMCMGAATYCEAVGEAGTAFWVYRRQVRPTQTDWERIGTDCRGGEEPGIPTTVQVAQQIQREFQSLVIINGSTRVDPGARGLINVDTIFSTDRTGPEPLPTITLLGHQVVITVTPEEYRWQFGDGASLTTTTPGRPKEKVVTHIYDQPGRYGASVTISWSGTFTIDGGEALTIRGRATTTGPPTPIEIVTARAELVAE